MKVRIADDTSDKSRLDSAAMAFVQTQQKSGAPCPQCGGSTAVSLRSVVFPHLLSQYLLNRTRTRIFCSLRPGLPCTVLTRKLEANIIHQLLGMAHDQSRDPNQHYPEPSGVPGSLFLTCGCRTRRRHKQLDCHSSCHGRETLPLQCIVR